MSHEANRLRFNVAAAELWFLVTKNSLDFNFMSKVPEEKIRTFTAGGNVRICWRRMRKEELQNLCSLNCYHQIVDIENERMNRACSVHGADEKSIQNVGPKT